VEEVEVTLTVTQVLGVAVNETMVEGVELTLAEAPELSDAEEEWLGKLVLDPDQLVNPVRLTPGEALTDSEAVTVGQAVPEGVLDKLGDVETLLVTELDKDGVELSVPLPVGAAVEDKDAELVILEDCEAEAQLDRLGVREVLGV